MVALDGVVDQVDQHPPQLFRIPPDGKLLRNISANLDFPGGKDILIIFQIIMKKG